MTATYMRSQGSNPGAINVFSAGSTTAKRALTFSPCDAAAYSRSKALDGVAAGP